MLHIECPWCGLRDESEFSYGGQAHIVRPEDPDQLDDQAWADYLFFRRNDLGSFRERWYHVLGCRRWFNVRRNTLTYRIDEVYPAGGAAPAEDNK